MKKAGLIILLVALIGGRILLQANLQWGMSIAGNRHLGLVVVGELVFLGLVFLSAAYCLRFSKWPRQLVIAPIVLAILSSPIMFQFGEFWGNNGWGVSDVVNLINAANLALLTLLVAFSFAPRAK